VSNAEARFAVALNTVAKLHTLCAVPQPDGSVVLTITPASAPERKQVLTVQPGEWAKLTGAMQAAMKLATAAVLTEATRTGWPESRPEDPPERVINRGRCVEWAELVCAQAPGTVMAEWDDPQSQLLHTFVYVPATRRYYDAECPGGAADVTGLPMFTWWAAEQVRDG
jgi:hypothetical protein